MPKRRFAASFDTTTRDLCATLVKMPARARTDFGGRLFRYEAEILQKSGLEFDDRVGFMPDGCVRITFWRAERGYAYECRAWGDYRDNFRACQRAITGQYLAFEEYKVTKPGAEDGFEALFGGFLLLGAGGREWHEVMGVRRDATAEEVRRAYIGKSKVLHPDKGGQPGPWNELNAAYDQAMAEIAGRVRS